ncbi:MAG: RNA polymerase sigma factor [Candidatus Aminicenantes bacterium]|nr:RNA polymerase sigma factor [Candidatus Aminicenantes bacterium]
MNDKKLIDACLRGGFEEFTKIMEKYRPKALAMSFNILRNREDAEDVCQNAFMKAYRNLGTFNQKNNFSSWFYTIVYNCCMDILRKRRRFSDFVRKEKSRSLSIFIEPDENRASVYDKHIKNILGCLSPKERAVLYLWACDRCSGEEIARILNCSWSTARVHLFKARKKIKKIMEKKNDQLRNA